MQDGIFIPESPQERRLQDWLFDPFRCLSRAVALVLGIAAIFIAAALCSLASVHFNGVLNAEYYSHISPPWLYIAEGLVAWGSMVISLQFFGAIVAPERFRFFDLVGTQALARWPYVLVALVALLPGVAEAMRRNVTDLGAAAPTAAHLPAVVAAVVVSFAVVVWSIVLMYRGYVLSTGVQGRKAVISFGIALLVAEIVSKVICIVLATSAGVLPRITPT